MLTGAVRLKNKVRRRCADRGGRKMRTYAQKQQQSQRGKSGDPARPGAAARSHDVHPILHRQPTIGDQAIKRLLQAKPDGLEAVSDASASSRFGHDFSRIPVHAKAPVKIQSKLAVNTPGDSYEQEADWIADQVVAAQAHQRVNGATPRIQ